MTMITAQAAALMLILGGCSGSANPDTGNPDTGNPDTGTTFGPFSSGDVRSASDATQASWTGDGSDWLSGQAVATGFVDGTGGANVIVGAPTDGSYEGDVPYQGFAYVVSASAQGANSLVDATATLSVGGASSDAFGEALATGDVNGDGIDDLVVGAWADAGAKLGGAAYVLHGPLSGDIDAGRSSQAIIEGEERGERLGTGVAIGDLNGDGSINIGIGSTRIGQENRAPGQVAIYDGSISGQLDEQSATTIYTGPQDLDGVGYKFADAGDTDGDGIADFTAGAFFYGDDDGGAAFVVYGPSTGAISLADADVFVIGDGAGYLGGGGLAALGDVDGDGLADVGLGSNQYGGTFDRTGRAYVLPGGRAGAMQADDLDIQASGENLFDMFGTQIAGGDVDGDGQNDLVVSAPANTNSSYAPGQVYVFPGPISGPLDAAADALWVIQGDVQREGFGRSLVAADLDGDGQQELVVGAPTNPEGGGVSGKTYLLSTLLLAP